MTESGKNPVLSSWEDASKRYQVAKSIATKLAESMKPLGFYNIPKLLDERRLEFGIPNGAFESYPTFDKVYIWQVALPGQGGESYEGTSILKPEQTQSWERNTAPRGVLVSAGLQALDCLRSTGVEIGHLVRFKKMSPFIMPVAEFEGKQLSVYVLRDGDIESSEDLAAAINARAASIVNVSDTGFDHRIRENGKVSGVKRSAYFDPSM